MEGVSLTYIGPRRERVENIVHVVMGCVDWIKIENFRKGTLYKLKSKAGMTDIHLYYVSTYGNSRMIYFVRQPDQSIST